MVRCRYYTMGEANVNPELSVFERDRVHSSELGSPDE